MTNTDTTKNILTQRRDARGRVIATPRDTPMKPIMDALNECLKAIRYNHPEVPNAVLVVGSSSMKNYGHFSPTSWDGIKAKRANSMSEHEIMLSGEGLLRGAEAVLATLIHECAHALAHSREIKDTSRQGRFHNGKFKALAEEIGIEVQHDKTIGWSITVLPDGTKKRYAKELRALRAALKTYRYGTLTGGKPPRKPTTIKLITASGRKLTVPISFHEAGDVFDATTGELFQPAQTGDAS